MYLNRSTFVNRKTFVSLAVFGASAALLAGCGGGGTTESPAAGGGTGTGSEAAGSEGAGAAAGGETVRDADADLVIWADELKGPSLQAWADEWAAGQGITVAIQSVANDQLQANFITANQAGNGPDIVIGAHDWIGNLVQNGAISAVNLPDTSDFNPVAIDAVTYEGQTYGMPYAVETLGLYANNALTDTPEPGTIEELVAAAEAGGAASPLCLPVGQQGSAYDMQPLYTSGGGYLFGENADGSLNPGDVGVGQEGSITAAEQIGELGEQGVLKQSITNDNNISLFTSGECAYMVSGPWALTDVEGAELDYTLSAIPGFEGLEPAQPFVGVNALYVASQGQNQGFAQQFVQDAASSTDAAASMYESNPLPPAQVSLAEELAQTDPNVVAFSDLAENGNPMPSIPEMAAIWGPLGQAEANIVGGADPAGTMQSAGEEINSVLGN